MNIFTFVTVGWLTPIMYRGFKTQLTLEQLLNIDQVDKSHALCKKVPYLSFHEQQGTKPKLFWLLLKEFRLKFLLAVILQAICVFLSLAVPQYLQKVILLIEQNALNPTDVILLFCCVFFATTFRTTSAQIMSRVQNNVKTIVSCIIYEKSLHLSPEARLKFQKGKILSLLNVDCDKVVAPIAMMARFICAPFQIVFSFILIYRLIGTSVLGGAAVLFILLFLQMIFTMLISQVEDEFLKYGDQRIKLLREMLMGIKMIKFRALETVFSEKVAFIRNIQLKYLKKYYALQVISFSLIQMAPIAMPIVAFLIYAYFQGDITPAIIFPAFNLFDGLFNTLLTIPECTSAIALSKVSWKRVNDFLNADQSEKPSNIPQDIGSIDITGKWTWSTNNETFMENETDPLISEQTIERNLFELDVDLNIKPGQKIAIVGKVASGKSSLLSAILAEMIPISGACFKQGKIGYCAQQPWIQTDTILSNIAFNKPVDMAKIDAICKSLALDQDFLQFSKGISTQVGERGVNLSGGQRQRIALARAIYSEPDIFLLDDVLSALDALVAQKVFRDAIKKIDKTVLLVTHNLSILPEFDHIILLEDGCIKQQGTYQELMHGCFIDSVNSMHQISEVAHQKLDDKAEFQSDITEEEDLKKGAVKFQVYADYIQRCGGAAFAIVLIFAAFLSSSSQIFTDFWLSLWTKDALNLPLWTYCFWYGLFGVLQFIFSVLVVLICLIGGYFASKHYHATALKGLLHAPISYFDSQPIGRILNRLSKDIDSIDEEIWFFFLLFVIAVSNLLGATSLLIYTQPKIIFMIIPLLICYSFILIFYQASNREFKRFQSISQSPLVSHMSETMHGISTIKAFNAEHEFLLKQQDMIDELNIPTVCRFSASSWVNLRLELLSTLLILGLLSVGQNLDSSMAALAITYCIAITGLLNLLLVSASQLESEFNSVERLKYFCDELPSEKPWTVDSDPKDWPRTTSITFKNVSAGYRQSLVLKNLTFHINEGEKIGIVGRTGSGKSTLVTCLLRIIEIDKGSIFIDGIDISTLGLHKIRSKCLIIPQEPVLFTGTIRSNLDMDSTKTDEELFAVVEQIGLKEYVLNSADKLDTEVTENGDNLSVGQRQLISLGRAILCKPKILILDEATASIDHETDKLIQKALQTTFKNTTVIAIAHRLNTIKNYDKILVLDKGELVDFDKPSVLLQKEGIFKQMAIAQRL